MSSAAKDRAVELLATVREYPSGYRSYAATETYVRPLTKLEDELIDALKALLEQPQTEELWEYRAAEVTAQGIDTWGPKGKPNVSWATFEDAQKGAAEDDAFVVRRRRPSSWEPVNSDV